MSWLILGAIAVAMGITFGGPSDMLSGGGVSGVAEVYGEDIRQEDFRLQLSMATRFGLMPKGNAGRKALGANEELIDGAIERLLLVHEGEKMGLAATKTEAEDIVIEGHVMLFGFRLDRLAPEDTFSNDLFQNSWLKSLGVVEKNYLEHQSDEFLAQTVRDLVSASVVVPESELWKQYEKTANTISLRYARYDFADFTGLADPSPERIDAYIAENTDALEKRYESQKSRFTALPRQVRLSLIQVDAGDEAKTALEATKATLTDSATFAAAAKAQSTHETAPRSGNFGWIDEAGDASSGLPEAVTAALPDLADGTVSDVIEADGSLWLLRAEARREGDVPKEDALKELAAEDLRDEIGKELAMRAAAEDQDAVTAGNALTDVFSQPGALGETTLFGGKPIEAIPVEGESEGEKKEGDEAAPAAADPIAGRSRPKAEMQSTGPVPKGQQIRGLGLVPDLMDDAWAHEGEAELLGEIYEVPGAVVLAGVESKKEATKEDFAEQRALLESNMRRLKARDVLKAWTQRRCTEAVARKDIKVSEETVKRLTTYDTSDETKEGEEPEVPESTYTVCSRVGARGGLLTRRLGLPF